MKVSKKQEETCGLSERIVNRSGMISADDAEQYFKLSVMKYARGIF